MKQDCELWLNWKVLSELAFEAVGVFRLHTNTARWESLPTAKWVWVRFHSVWFCVGASVKYSCQLLRLHGKKVPLPTPPASTSTSLCLMDGALIRKEEV